MRNHDSGPQMAVCDLRVSQSTTWDQTAAFIGHPEPKTTRRYIHFMPKDKRATVESISFEV